jgi:hypothetical protein
MTIDTTGEITGIGIQKSPNKPRSPHILFFESIFSPQEEETTDGSVCFFQQLLDRRLLALDHYNVYLCRRERMMPFATEYKLSREEVTPYEER